MKWLNEPTHWNFENNSLTVTSDPNTDFWRKTHDDGIRDNGHFFSQSVVGDFRVRVKVSGQYRDLYDQSGLMVRQDETYWLKCGIEFVEGQQYASAVVTRDFSDWSILPVENPQSLWFQCEREGRTITVSYSLDGTEYQMIRQCTLTDEPELHVGMMLASPKGNGFKALFEDFELSQ